MMYIMNLSFLEYIIRSIDSKITFSILSDRSVRSIIIIIKSILIIKIFFLRKYCTPGSYLTKKYLKTKLESEVLLYL